jgi:hypothetical protein
LEAAHIASGLHHTLLISHRPEIQQAISQHIVLTPGKGIEVQLG